MIEIKNGNLLNVHEGYIVHGCNSRGYMGAGIAKQIKNKYHSAYQTYRSTYDNFINSIGKMPIGTNSYYRSEHVNHPNVVIVNAVTQNFYGYDERRYCSYDAIQECFRKLNLFIVNSITPGVPMHVNFPKIGCGLGGGDWERVRDIIDSELDDCIKKTLWIYP